MNIEWEKIDEEIHRAKILGGWLVTHKNAFSIPDSSSLNFSYSICFVPDPNHEWN